jgi:hypothetical protein
MTTTKAGPRKTGKKVEAFVEERIEDVRSLWRQRERTALALRFALVVAGYALGIALFDLATEGSDASAIVWTRYLLFAAFLVSAAWTGTQFALSLRRTLNPYFVARHIEKTLPNAKNAVINWLDLKDEPMASAIRGSLSQQAASSLKQTDPEETVAAPRGWLWGISLLLVSIGLIALLAWRPTQFGSLMQRAFVPFQGTQLATRVRIEMKNPAQGNVTLSDRENLEVAADIRGPTPSTNQPGAPMLHFRRNESEAFASLPLLLENSGLWVCRLGREQLQSGITYRITAADAATPTYEVKVRPTPLATRFEITYTPRPYRNEPQRRAEFPNEKYLLPRFQDYRGTKVTLIVHANVPVRQGHLEFEARDRQTPVVSFPMSPVPEEPNALSGEFTLDRSGELRILFVSRDGDTNADRQPNEVRVLGDEAPLAVLMKPGEDVSLPANGTLAVEGSARDDVGLASVDLHFKVGSTKLKTLPAAKIDAKETQLQCDFFEIIPLEQLTTATGEPYPLAKGQILEYWLEARDRCDVPGPQIGKSKAYKVRIVEPQSPKEQKEQRQQAQNEKKRHDEQKQNQAKNAPNQGDKDASGHEDKLKDVLDQAQKKKEQQENRGQAKGGDEPKSDQAKAEPKQDGNAPGEPQSPAAQNKEKGDGPSPPSKTKDQGDTAGQKDAGQAKNKGPEQKEADPSAGKDSNPALAKEQGMAPNGGKPDQGQAKAAPDGKGPPQQQAKEQGPMGNDKQPSPQAKDAKDPTSHEQPSKGDAKKGPQQAPSSSSDGNDASGQAKGASPQPPTDKGSVKSEPAQGGTKQAGTPEPQQKTADSSAPQKGATKGDPGKGGDVVGSAKDDGDPAREATKEELDQIRKLAKEKGKDGQRAAKSLADRAKHSGDERAMKETEEFLKEAGHPELAKSLADARKGQAPTPQQEGKNRPNQKDPPATPATDPLGDPNGKVTDAPRPDLPPMAATDEFRKRGGNLQLEDLKKLVTPEMLKKSGLTEQDWAKFLADAARNQNLLPQLQKDRQDELLRGKGTRPGQGIRTIESSGADSTLDRLQVGPPPELRQDYIEFTTPKKR